MAIHRVRNNLRLPILGKIRLGVIQSAPNGKDRPADVEHFVLNDKDGCAPVRKVYGDNPDSIDIMFTSDDPDRIIPSWFKLFGAAKRGSDGENLGGLLRCQGTGMDGDQPGTAMWFDKRDPLTGIIPNRPCLEMNCPDYRDRNGNQQCKQVMTIYAMLPLVSYDGVFQIDTRSWNSINDFERVIHHQNNIYKTVAGRPFRIIRRETLTPYTDSSGQKRQGKHHIMYLEFNPDFITQRGAEAAALLESCRKNTFLQLPTQEELLQLSPVSEALEAPEDIHIQKVLTAEEVANDPEVKAAFDEYEKVLGKTFSDKQRLIAVRKKEGLEDVKKAVLLAIADGINFVKQEAMAKLKESQAAQQQPAQEQPAQEQPAQEQPVDVPVTPQDATVTEGIM